jgi:RPA family protein
MPMQRQTAVRARIVDIVSGEFVKKEGMEPSYVVTPGKDSISRARIVGTVVGKFDSEDGNFSSVTLDDATGTIRAKLWREVALLNGVKAGDLVSLVGKVREYEGEIYIVPEIVTPVTPGEEALARLEVLKKIKERNAGAAGKKEKAAAGEEAEEAPQAGTSEQPGGKEAEGAAEKGEDPRKKIMGIIEQDPDGIKYPDLMQQAGLPEETVEDVINELLGEGVCYEPTPGKIKKI